MQDGTQAERAASERVTQPRKKPLLGLALLALAGAAAFGFYQHEHHAPPDAASPAASAGAQTPAHLADFRGETPSPEAKLMANWVVGTGDSHQHAFVLVDKKDARVYVFTPQGRLEDSAPALLGQAHGDDLVPGTADKSLAEMKPDEKITPAGRFVAEPGVNAEKEDVIWVNYDAAISMHRVRPMVARERRLERLATLSTDDNRISFGCINLPVSFYENVAKPTVAKYGAIIYVVPEVKTVQQVFGAYDVTDPAQIAAAHQAGNVATANKDEGRRATAQG
ncbi:hypothetical protein [Ramlibacter sp.]|uniref:hypothetical protein n=1 Tax=Ramlibacter sp. TaxID=1917967 RepID=UPI00260802EF|nr:hypothetical protein [Ramlibacter sp.]MDB5958084.1 hypothetical protein [Ramlibacter sp.]